MRNEIEPKVVSIRPRLADWHALIRKIATEDQRVYFSTHAKERMAYRGITRLDAVRVLQRGHIDGQIEAGNYAGEWKCKVVANVKGSREIGVVTLVIDREKILVKTVEWEDI
jgi:Domain of unknown function (DUF4258)